MSILMLFRLRRKPNELDLILRGSKISSLESRFFLTIDSVSDRGLDLLLTRAVHRRSPLSTSLPTDEIDHKRSKRLLPTKLMSARLARAQHAP